MEGGGGGGQCKYINKCSESLQSDIDNLIGWSNEWKLVFNTGRQMVVMLGNRKTQTKYM